MTHLVDPAVTVRSPVSASRWSDDAFLDRLRLQGDVAADACFDALGHTKENFRALFAFLNSNHAVLPDEAPDSLKSFFAEYARTPTPDGQALSRERLERGENVFMTHAASSALVLLVKSLPAGYGAPNLALVLAMSGDLGHHPYKRLLGVLQMVVNVTAPGGFERDGRALITAPKLRLLHAGVRHLVRQRIPEYESRYGVPVNHEDMLGTIMGFSLLVIRGLQQLRVGLTEQQAEDYYYLWRAYALAMGIHPPGAPDSTEHLPADLTQAETFYQTYARRHYRPASENPEGVELTRVNLSMLQHLLADTPLRLLGSALVPRIYMQELLGADGLVLRGVQPVVAHRATKWILFELLRLWTWVGAVIDRDGGRHFHERLSQTFFEGLIVRTMKGEVTFLIPESLADLHALARNQADVTSQKRSSA